MNDEKTDTRLRLFVGLVVLIGLGCIGWAFAEIDSTPGPAVVHTIALAVIIAAANGPVIRVRYRSQHLFFSSTSGAILVAVATVPPPFVIIITAAGVAAAKLLTQRDALKIVFNIAKDTQAAAAAAIGAATVGLHPAISPGSGRSWDRLVLGLAVAAVCYAIVDDALGHTVLALASRSRRADVARKNWDIAALARLANLAVATVTVLVIQHDHRLLIAMPPAVWALQLVAVNRLRSRAEREAWQRLAQTTDELNVTDLSAVVRSAVSRAPHLFSADEAELELLLAGTARLLRGSAHGVEYDGAVEPARDTQGHVIQAPLRGHNGDQGIGVLRLRFRKPVRFNEPEQYKLQAFASALYTAIRNASAYAELERIAHENAHAATHDPLTGLANRRALLEQAGEVVTGRHGDGLTALLLIDLNHFKEVNDTLGHAAGDQVLVEVARRLAAAARPADLVARLGGDEFAVLLTGLAAPAVAAHRAESLLSALEGTIEVDGMRLTVEACGGIALASGTGGVTELLRRADVAMYQAKRSGQRTAAYVHARDTADVGRLMLGGELSRAVAQHEFMVDFQPIVDLGTGAAVSVEALARWHHPQHGNLNPRRFLETVERSGQLPAFADAVLDQALAAMRSWREAGFDIPVAVNVSPRSLLNPGFAGSVLDRLSRADAPADRLVLELTETLTLSQLEVVERALVELRDAGIRLALDDFGTGSCSLSVLSRIPVHQLKIDRDVVRNLETSPEASAVVRSAVDLARSLNLHVVAEGVESEPQRRTLFDLGCVAGQGHLFARPMAAPRLLAALRRGCEERPGTFATALHDAGAVIRLPQARRGGRGRSSLPHLPA